MCSEKEAIALVLVLAGVLGGNVWRIVNAAHPPFNDLTYAEMDSLFEALSAHADSTEGIDPVRMDTIHVGFGATFDHIPSRSEHATDRVQRWALVDTLDKPKASFPITINSADSRTLQALPRIGPAMAERILAYRKTRGHFEGPDDLSNIKGIGPKTLERLLPLVVFDVPDSPSPDSTDGSGQDGGL